MSKIARRKATVLRRKRHVRKRVRGTGERPRMVINRSLKYMAVNLVDDDRGITVMGASTKNLNLEPFELPEKPEKFKVNGKPLPLKGRVADSFRLGMAMAKMAKEQGIARVVFDRNGLRYHGRVRAVAEGARKGGLEL